MAADSPIEDEDAAHMAVRAYFEAQAEARGITLRWDHWTMNRELLRRVWKQPAYELLFNQRGRVERWTGSRGERWKA
jgi:hypothetical protein